MIRMMLVDDQDIIRTGLRYVLKAVENISVVAEASNGEEAINRLNTHVIDLILMDLRMPIMNGVDATKIIKEKYPHIKVIVFTTFQEDQEIFESLKNGASGYLLKDSEPDKIIEAIHTVYEGGALIQPSVANKVIKAFAEFSVDKPSLERDSRIERLTEREVELLGYIALGYNNKEIGNKMFVSEGTVKNHLSSILSKLEMRDRTQLAIFAVKNGFGVE